jgi:hypothetical protein
MIFAAAALLIGGVLLNKPGMRSWLGGVLPGGKKEVMLDIARAQLCVQWISRHLVVSTQ